MKDKAILVVDDDPFIGRLISGLLEAEGARPTAIGDSRKALELFAAHAFDLVITDYHMPVLTGLELARRMRTLKPAIPICLATARSEALYPHEVAEFNGLLTKPFDKEHLTALVAKALPPRDSRIRLVTRPPRYKVDWPVDCVPLAAAALTGREPVRRRAALRNISEHGLAFVGDPISPGERFCAFLIYPPEDREPALMVGEVRWSQDEDGRRVAGTRSLFWGSEREKALIIERAM
jgi:CheY-like chemotaxis protein